MKPSVSWTWPRDEYRRRHSRYPRNYARIQPQTESHEFRSDRIPKPAACLSDARPAFEINLERGSRKSLGFAGDPTRVRLGRRPNLPALRLHDAGLSVRNFLV